MRRPGLGLLALMLALTVGACGTPPGTSVATANSGDPSNAPAELSPEERQLKFAECMREHGVEMPDPDPDSDGPSVGSVRIGNGPEALAEYQAALEACREYSPAGDGGSVQADPEMQERMLRYSQCMRDNGVEAFPDPDGTSIRVDESVSSDPDFQVAQEACVQAMLPGAGGAPVSG